MSSIERKYARFLAPAIFLLSIIIAASLISTKHRAATAPIKEVARSVETLTAQTGALSPVLPVFAQVSTANHASLRAAVTADVSRLLTLQGSIVAAGDSLVLLDDREATLAVEQRQADLQEAVSQIDAEIVAHENELFVIRDDKGKSAEHNREQIIKKHSIRLRGLQAKKQRAEAALQRARLDLKRTRITAPFNGQVTAVHVSTGDRVRPGDKIADLYDKTTLELRGVIPNRYLAPLQVALRDALTLRARGQVNGVAVEAQLTRLDGMVDKNNGGVNAFFDIVSDKAFLYLGRSLKMQLELPPEDNAFIVPNSALYGVDTIYKIVGQRLKAVKVTRLGDSPPRSGVAQSLLRSDDIADGDIILATQIPNAVENLLVNVVDAI